MWDRETGEPVYNAIVWQDRRTAPFCESLKKQGLTETIRSKTGLVIDAYFSGSKIRWILDNVKGARKKAEEGKLAFGTVDSWLVWKFTRGRVHATDVSNAGRTMLFNIREQQWDTELLKHTGRSGKYAAGGKSNPAKYTGKRKTVYLPIRFQLPELQGISMPPCSDRCALKKEW